MKRIMIAFAISCLSLAHAADGVFTDEKPAGAPALLSDNVRPGQTTKTFAAGTKIQVTGATYRWIRSGPFASDEESYRTGMRPNGTGRACFDGHKGGWAETQTFSSWVGGVWATVEIDLQESYLITAADIWTLRRKDRDTEFAEVAVSRDGKTFVSAARLEDKIRPRTVDSFIRVRAELARPAAARYVRLRCRRRQTVPQQNIGEIALWGHRLPSGIRFLPAGSHPPVIFTVKGIECGVANLDWSEFAKRAKGVKGWCIYQSGKPFLSAKESGVELLRRVPGRTQKLALYPLEPERTYHLGITAIYGNGESPAVRPVEHRTPAPLSCVTFGDMMAANHYWMGGGARAVQRPHEEAWEQVATELLGKTEMNQIRWWQTVPRVIDLMYEQGIGLMTGSGGRAIESGNALGCYLFYSGNEPDLSGRPMELYLASLKRDYAAAKKAHAANVICAPTSGLSDTSVEWLDRFYAAGAKEHFDVLDLHTYCKVSASYKPPPGYPKACPEVLFDRMAQIRKIMAKHGDADKPVISTEFGYTDCNVGNPAGTITLEMKANYLVRGFVIHHVLGFQRVFLYSFRDEGDDPYFTEHHFGIIDYECQKKPAYHAMKALGDVLGKSVLVGPLAGCKAPSYGYLYREPDTGRYTAIVWNGTGETGGVFATKAGEVDIVDIYGKTRSVLVARGRRVRVPYGPAPIYLRADQPLSQIDQYPTSAVLDHNARVRVSGVPSVIYVSAKNPEARFMPRVANDGERAVDVELRVSLGSSAPRGLTVRIEPGQEAPCSFHPPVGKEFLTKGQITVGWEEAAGTYSEKRDFFVRRLPKLPGNVTTRVRFAGCPKPVVLLSSADLDLAIDVARGCRVLDFIDRKGDANQVNMDYDKLPGLQKVPFAYGIWFQAGIGLKNAPFRVVEAKDGKLVARADSKDGFRVRYAFALTGNEWSMDVTMTNRSKAPRRLSFRAHPEYRVGGNGESDRDVILLPIQGETAKMPFWNGLGARSHAPLVEPWWQIDDTVAKISLRQEWTPGAFGQPTIWFGEEFYNVEMFSPPERMLKPGESWQGRLTWRLIRR